MGTIDSLSAEDISHGISYPHHLHLHYILLSALSLMSEKAIELQSACQVRQKPVGMLHTCLHLLKSGDVKRVITFAHGARCIPLEPGCREGNFLS